MWHPYTEMSHYRQRVDPLVVVRAQGSRLFDADGRSYLDANASWWSCLLGHGHGRDAQEQETCDRDRTSDSLECNAPTDPCRELHAQPD